ncbi:hypothetical protein ACHAXA_003291 [Cyclostephanos tholiformis]|uniref:Cupin-like domain-containing protein n=1 Tax=Cyclostephanos tholiformis TaxID=382380 RepID=A0ABD3RCE1_9STRA
MRRIIDVARGTSTRTTSRQGATGGGSSAGGRRLVRVVRRTKRSGVVGDGRGFVMGLVAFGLSSLIGMATYRIFGRSTPSPPMQSSSSHSSPSLILHKTFYPNNDGEVHNSDSLAAGGLLGRLRGGMMNAPMYVLPDSMAKIGNKARWYADLRFEYDTSILPIDESRSMKFVADERTRYGGTAVQSPAAKTPYDVTNCPDVPPPGYPMHFPVLDVLNNWPTDSTDPPPEADGIYQALCVFDYRADMHKAENYRDAEVPFVMRDDPSVARSAERWNHPGYLDKLLMGKEDVKRRTEYSPDNHFMFWIDKRSREERIRDGKMLRERRRNGEGDPHAGFGRGDQGSLRREIKALEEMNALKGKLKEAMEYAGEHEDDDGARREVSRLQRLLTDAKRRVKAGGGVGDGGDDGGGGGVMERWKPPTEMLRMTYLEWLEHANVTDDKLGPDNPHWYFRLIGCGNMGEKTADGSCDKGSSEWLFDELPFFQPRNGDERSFYLVQPEEQMGIHCRFGMRGVIAENHFDLSRNAIALLAGRRRYILAHPSQCGNMNLLPRGHPSARHSAVDWSNPDLEGFPTFVNARVNEIIMFPGDVLYLPTNWFHFIVSLELNMQCNTRSGGEEIYRDEITKCGF